MRLRRDGGEIVVEFEEGELGMLRTLVGEYVELLSQGDDDPAMDRLFPDGYRDDPEAAAEFRRYTRAGLVSRKAAGARAFADALAPEVRLAPDAAAAWLPPITDFRLVLAERLGIRQDGDPIPDTPVGAVYEWLGHLQESMLALMRMIEED